VQQPLDIHQLNGKRACVMGLGSFGGGVAAANFLHGNGAHVTVSDQKTEAELSASCEQLHPEIETRLGGHDWSHFEDADTVVLNPAIPPRNEFLRRLQTTDKWLTSEIELFCQLNRGQVIAVTGSNGKSTTTTFIHSLLESAGVTTWLGGNIGVSLLDKVDRIGTEDWVVLELSSFQLHGLSRINFRPDIAVVTNLAPNHIDWHETESHYFSSKRAILAAQTDRDWRVLNGTDARLSKWTAKSQLLEFGAATADRFVSFADGRLTLKIDAESEAVDMELPQQFYGEHNQLNLQAAVGAVRLCGVSLEAIQSSVSRLKPLEFRLQPVGEVDGVLFVNDAKATTPESAIAALKAMDRPTILLAGGSDKGVDLTEFARAICEHTRAAALMGQVANCLQTSIDLKDPTFSTAQPKSFREAFRWAVDQAQSGDVVLLSAGCASFGWFENYTDRGHQFSSLVNDLATSRHY
jgi:UDP-N-acetylmuramoylalanine--D-glutamate ligase